MSTIVYQGVQSCFESQLVETTILKLKVAPITSTDNECHLQEFNKNSKSQALEGFNFIQNTPSSPKEKQSTYIHPSAKTSPRLSQKSLELCTENLGSETGSDDGIDIDILSFNEYSTSDALISEEEEKKVTWKIESRNSSKGQGRSFPPPLTSIRSSNSIQCRHHRENGRLIIEAVESTTRNTYLQAERSDGRLRLSFFNDCEMNFDTKMYDEGNEVDLEEDDDDDDEINGYESDVYDEDCHEGGEEHGDDEKNVVKMEEIIGNKIDIEGEIGIEKFQRLSRCIEGGHDNRDLCHWTKSLWVATS